MVECFLSRRFDCFLSNWDSSSEKYKYVAKKYLTPLLELLTIYLRVVIRKNDFSSKFMQTKKDMLARSVF